MKRTPELIVVTGPESSGTRLAADLVSLATGWPKLDLNDLWRASRAIPHDEIQRALAGRGETIRTAGVDIPERAPLDLAGAVTRRSMPHGGRGDRCFYGLRPFDELAGSLGWWPRYIFTTRDGHIVARSKAREHTGGDVDLAGVELVAARNEMVRFLDSRCAILSFESLLFFGYSYVVHVLGDIDVRVDDERRAVERMWAVPIEDANRRYLMEETAR